MLRPWASLSASPRSASSQAKKNDTPISHDDRSAFYFQMTHCHSGVEKGIKKGGNPIEVM